MHNSFQKRHIFDILSSYEEQRSPLDLFLSGYFRAHKSVGANDRRLICQTVYGMIRWKGLLDHFVGKTPCWEGRYAIFVGINPLDFREKEEIPIHVRASFPKAYFELLEENYGQEKALELALISNQEAPTTIRVNLLKTTREALFEKWKKEYAVSLSTHSPWGIHFHKKINFLATDEFKQGLFEIQDEGSQLIARLVGASAGQEVLDFCAGAGGKTLAFAPIMQNKGQVYLHDIRPLALEQAKKRLRRAGIQNAQVLLPDSPKKKLLKKRMDWVLLDVPCSGSGTLRRNPDMKWKFDTAIVDRLVEEQRRIVEEALVYLRPDGFLVYATCSLFKQENEEQIAFFEKTFNLKCVGTPFYCHPQSGGMDGFFGALLKRAF